MKRRENDSILRFPDPPDITELRRWVMTQTEPWGYLDWLNFASETRPDMTLSKAMEEVNYALHAEVIRSAGPRRFVYSPPQAVTPNGATRCNPKRLTSICPSCGQEYVRNAGNQRYCNNSCQNAARLNKSKERRETAKVD